MENIIRKRHPNSLPVLMWAASAAPQSEATKAPSVEFLEKRVGKLEGELESQEEEAKRSLRAVEQKYNAMKVMTSIVLTQMHYFSLVSVIPLKSMGKGIVEEILNPLPPQK